MTKKGKKRQLSESEPSEGKQIFQLPKNKKGKNNSDHLVKKDTNVSAKTQANVKDSPSKSKKKKAKKNPNQTAVASKTDSIISKNPLANGNNYPTKPKKEKFKKQKNTFNTTVKDSPIKQEEKSKGKSDKLSGVKRHEIFISTDVSKVKESLKKLKKKLRENPEYLSSIAQVANVSTNVGELKDSLKKSKKKSKDNLDNKVQDTTIPRNIVEAEDSLTESKKKKKKKAKKNKSSQCFLTEATLEAPKEEPIKREEVKKVKVISSKRKDKFKQKRTESREQRKVERQSVGQFSALNRLSLEEIKSKIAEIESRETLSNRAKRQLSKLRKIQKVEEGTIEDKPQVTHSQKHKGDFLQTDGKEHKNKKFKNEQVKNKKEASGPFAKGDNKKGKKEKQAVRSVTKSELFIEDRVGDQFLDDSENTDDYQNVSGGKKSKNIEKGKKQKFGKGKIQDEEESDSEMQTDDDELGELCIANGKEEDSDESDSDDLSDEQEIITSKTVLKKNKKAEKLIEDEEDESDSEDAGDKENEVDDVPAGVSPEKVKPAQESKKQQKNKANEADSPGKKRYVLFVGNMAYETTTVDLKKHFLNKVDKVKDVRIPMKPGSNTPRGFAYVEVENSTDYEKALSLHRTFVSGRQINVEYTSSGSKPSGKRPEMVHKNKKLHAMRKAGMLAGSKKDSNKRSFRRNFQNKPRNKSGSE